MDLVVHEGDECQLHVFVYQEKCELFRIHVIVQSAQVQGAKLQRACCTCCCGTSHISSDALISAEMLEAVCGSHAYSHEQVMYCSHFRAFTLSRAEIRPGSLSIPTGFRGRRKHFPEEMTNDLIVGLWMDTAKHRVGIVRFHAVAFVMSILGQRL